MFNSVGLGIGVVHVHSFGCIRLSISWFRACWYGFEPREGYLYQLERIWTNSSSLINVMSNDCSVVFTIDLCERILPAVPSPSIYQSSSDRIIVADMASATGCQLSLWRVVGGLTMKPVLMHSMASLVFLRIQLFLRFLPFSPRRSQGNTGFHLDALLQKSYPLIASVDLKRFANLSYELLPIYSADQVSFKALLAYSAAHLAFEQG